MFGLLGSVVNGITGLFNASSQRKAQKEANKTNLQIARETNQAQMDLAKYQADRNYELWQENNAYNTPSAQMERYNEAGLNPNLIYGEGQSASAGNSSSPADGYQAPTLQRAHVNPENFQLPMLGDTLMQGLMMVEDINKRKAEVDNIRQSTLNLQSDNDLKILQIAYQKFANSKTRDEADVWREFMKSRISSLHGQAHLSESNALTNDALRPFVVNLKTKEVEHLMLQNDDLKYKIKNLNPASKNKIYAEIGKVLAETELAKMNTHLSSTSADLNERRWMESVSNQTGRDLENRIKEILLNNGLNLKESGVTGMVQKLINNLLNL